MKLKSEKFKNITIAYGDERISFDDTGTSNDVNEGVAKDLATLDFFEIVNETKKTSKEEVKNEKVEEKEKETKKTTSKAKSTTK
ncbi:hypothetical protein KQI68_06660 [Peptoniphilus sp. MSJ-1]|uniref:Uncharacterized protein n=1 Tax=Peptoniphilus ovalis TaxID=2841503 RepID=A0ABS6FH74_9FIRM|nr:hypothetical protein [Peptoniphilus ovalis]MBU5669519.1 hypothetical protein [Peptoniphilus ovalis]